MKKISDQTRNELAMRFQIQPESLAYLGGGRPDSDGIVYTFSKDGKPMVLKIVSLEQESQIDRFTKRMEFAKYLGENGIPTAYPKADANGSILYTKKEDNTIFAACIMDYVDGYIPKTDQLTDSFVTDWGRLTGKMNHLTKEFSVWKNLDESAESLGHEDEIDGFYEWCRNEIVKQKWLEMKQLLSTYEINRNTYGMSHNDNHQNNIIMSPKGLVLIDYDCAGCNFMAQDIFVPIQGILFDRVGGFERPVTDMDVIKHFYDCFLSGYEKENHIDDFWLNHMEVFLNYRRLLLYTVMQDWLENDKKIGSAWMQMIENPTPFTIV